MTQNKLLPTKVIMVLIVLLSFGTVMGVVGYLLFLKKNPPISVQPTIEPTPKAVKKPNLKLTETKLSIVPRAYNDLISNIPVFSPDGKKVAYETRNGGVDEDMVRRYTYYMNVAGEGVGVDTNNDDIGQDYDFIGDYKFSPDSKQFAYVAGRKGSDRIFVVLNDKELGGDYAGIWNIAFSPDSQHFAYGAEKGDKSLVVKDNKEGVIYDSIEDLVFSPDSKQLAYVAKKDNKEFVVLNDKEGPSYNSVSGPVFSPDSKQLAYYAWKEGDNVIVVNSEEIGASYDDILDFTFSPNNELVYSAKKGSDLYLVKNGQEEVVKYDQIKNFVFSPDGSQLAFTAVKDKKAVVVISGKEMGRRYDAIDDLTFSPDGKHFAYEVRIEEKGIMVVLDNKEGAMYAEILSSPVFSSDSSRLVYAARKDNEKFIVLDGFEWSFNGYIFNFGFTLDGKYITYGTQSYNQAGGELSGDELSWWVGEISEK